MNTAILKAETISTSHLEIHEKAPADLVYSLEELRYLLRNHLKGLSLHGLPLRTRSKRVKTEVCNALGYPIPAKFTKTHPRFLGQDLDIFTQKSNNLQIWNEDIDLKRRYAIIKLNSHDDIETVSVVTGKTLNDLANTKTLTSKFQATMRHFDKSILFSSSDTSNVKDLLCCNYCPTNKMPTDPPNGKELLPISSIFSLLLPLVGTTLTYSGATQERNRGANLHEKICTLLGYKTFKDNGCFPDIPHQLIEVKLQTSPTIDLGQHAPTETLPLFKVNKRAICCNDIRYVIFDGKLSNEDTILLSNLYVVTGKDFSSVFRLFEGRKINKKRQIPLPSSFFD